MPTAKEKRVIALGFFDGVHLGHAALLRRAVRRAGELDAIPAACTFDAHPAALVSRETVPLLTTPEDRGVLMARLYGIREVIIAHFNRALMTMPWDRFVTDYLAAGHGACHLVAGEDHRFGYKGEGTAEKLKALCASLGLGCDIIPAVKLEGETVSSTLIRSLVEAGELERAGRFLGHPYSLSGRVEHGKRLGSRLGFPTVNLIPDPRLLLPAYGVYAAKVWVLPEGNNHGPVRAGEGPYPAVTNVGVRPTVDDGGKVTVESFLLDFDGDLYGRTLRLELCRRLRFEQTFDSLEALRRQVQLDAQAAAAYFGQ